MFLVSCKKEQIAPNTGKSFNVSTLADTASPELVSNITVSATYGFLVIPDQDVYADYLDFLENNNTADIEYFFTSIGGFNSQADVAGQADNYFAPSIYNSEYVCNEDAIIQIGNTVYRGVKDNGYILAMPVSSLNSTTYGELVDKTFNTSVMCKLKVGAEEYYGEEISDIENFIASNSGYDGTSDPSNNPGNQRKVTHWYSAGGVTVCDESWYFLGIRVKHRVTFFDLP